MPWTMGWRFMKRAKDAARAQRLLIALVLDRGLAGSLTGRPPTCDIDALQLNRVCCFISTKACIL
jgi:hypothetical protein